MLFVEHKFRVEIVGGNHGLLGMWFKDLQAIAFSFRHTEWTASHTLSMIEPFLWSLENRFAFYYHPNFEVNFYFYFFFQEHFYLLQKKFF